MKLSPGAIIGMILFLGMSVLFSFSPHGFTLFPFVSDPDVRTTLTICLAVSIFGAAGIVALFRKVDDGILGFIISVFAILWIIAFYSIALYLFFRFVI
jgi:hypothetical protein